MFKIHFERNFCRLSRVKQISNKESTTLQSHNFLLFKKNLHSNCRRFKMLFKEEENEESCLYCYFYTIEKQIKQKETIT